MVSTPTSVTLYGTKCSYFTAKTRSMLICKDIPFTERTADATVFATLIIPKTGVQFIPIVVLNEGIELKEVVLQDTTVIADVLQHVYYSNKPFPLYPNLVERNNTLSGPQPHALAHLICLFLELFCDEFLPIIAMHMRWNHEENQEYIFKEFGATSNPQGTPLEQLESGKNVAKYFKGVVPKLGVSPSNMEGVEILSHEMMDLLDAHFSREPYLLGDAPFLCDYALVGPFYAHLYLDPFPGHRRMRERWPHLVDYLEKMHVTVTQNPDQICNTPHWLGIRQQSESQKCMQLEEQHNIAFPNLSANFPLRLSDSLADIVGFASKNQFPILCASAHALIAFADSLRPKQTKIPRGVGEINFTLSNDVIGSRAALSYSLWQSQRVLDYFRREPLCAAFLDSQDVNLSLSKGSREQLRQFFLGGIVKLREVGFPRLVRKHNKVEIEEFQRSCL